MIRALLDWTGRNLREFEWRKAGRTPYSVLVSEILLKRTTGKAVSRVYEEFLSKYPDVEALSAARRKELRSILSRIGLQEQRSRGIQDAAHYLLAQCDGHIADSYDELMKIPHVGRYTANAILSFGFGKSRPVVDSNVIRIFRRTFASKIEGHPQESLFWEIASELVPARRHERFNWGLLDIGATVCTFRRPRCQSCPLGDLCDTGRRARIAQRG